MAEKYILRIRNKAKQTYARTFLAWMLAGELGPDPEYKPLSYMAAQSVRITIRQLVEEEAQS